MNLLHQTDSDWNGLAENNNKRIEKVKIMDKNQKNNLLELVKQTNWASEEAVKTASNQVINIFKSAFPDAEGIKVIADLYPWMTELYNIFEEQSIDSTLLWVSLLSKNSEGQNGGIQVLYTQVFHSVMAFNYKALGDKENLIKVLQDLYKVAFEINYDFFSTNINENDYAERLTRTIFANTFYQVDMKLFQEEPLKSVALEWIEKMKHSFIIMNNQTLHDGIIRCEQELQQ